MKLIVSFRYSDVSGPLKLYTAELMGDSMATNRLREETLTTDDDGRRDRLVRVVLSNMPLSALCLLTTAAFFAASLTPSLMPRSPVVQGALAGSVAIIGYGAGYLLQWLWLFLGIPKPLKEWHSRLRLAGCGLALCIVLAALWKSADWQNATRAVMALPPVSTAHPMTIIAVALLVFGLIWLLALVFQFVLKLLRDKLDLLLPRRVSALLGLSFAAWLFWAIGDGVLVRYGFALADASFKAADRFVEPTQARPFDPMITGSTASLISWDHLGKWGRDYISRTPSREEISTFSGAGAMDPIRVYVGLRAAPTPQERALLALEELKRVGGFQRSALVVMVPVGTGWMDPGGQDSLEFILGGDVATVAVQYSYLKGALSVLTDTEVGEEQSRQLFSVIYNHWTKLPKDNRPKLYVHGLSQGAQISQSTIPFFDLLADPISGALWTGSPFFSPVWQHVRDSRLPGSPAWLPKYGNGSLIRSINQRIAPETYDAPWGPIRIVFLNYGSDPIVAFTYATAYRKPDWMQAPRAFDVSPELRWVPIVTMLQIALDTAFSLSIPRHGHNYVAEDYIDAWAAVLDPPDWDATRGAQLKGIFNKRAPAF